MLLNKSLVFGLLSLLYTVDAIKSPSKPALAKRQDAFTATNGICTAVCKELASMGPSKATECDVYCSEDDEDDDDYSIITLSPTSTVTSTVTTTTKAVLKQRDMMTTEAPLNRRSIYSTVQGDCTVVCWDLMPGTECDLQCSSAVKTEMPGPTNAARAVNLEAVAAITSTITIWGPALPAPPAGTITVTEWSTPGFIGARDDGVTVTVTSIPEYCTPGPVSSISTTIAGTPAILPMQMPQAAGDSDSSIRSMASAALSEASAMLSSMAATAPISANVTSASPKSTGSAPTVSATKTTTKTATKTATTTTSTTASETSMEPSTVSETSTTSTTVLETSTQSTTASDELTTSSETTTASTSQTTTTIATVPFGAAPEHTVSTGLVLSLLIGLAANVAFLI